MKLLTKELEKRFAEVGRQDEVEDPIAICKFFNPTGIGRWFACSYDPENKLFYGYASLFGDWNDEYGDFSLTELEEFRGKFGLGIERDLSFQETPMSKVIEEYTKEIK